VLALRVLLLALLSLPAAACGGEEVTSDDARTVRAMLRSDAAVQRAVQPLLLCLPERPACYRRSGPAVVSVVERERRRVDVALENTDDTCLEEVASLYGRSLDEYGNAGQAATTADVAAVDAALAKTTELEIAYSEKLGTCGFAEGELARAGTKLREANTGMLRLEQEFAACQDEACVTEVAGRGRRLATDAAASVDELLADLEKQGEDVPSCFPRALRKWQDAFRAVGGAMAALEDLDLETADRAGTQAGELAAEAQDDLADCMSSAGP
jgi:hypothetical protein